MRLRVSLGVAVVLLGTAACGSGPLSDPAPRLRVCNVGQLTLEKVTLSLRRTGTGPSQALPFQFGTLASGHASPYQAVDGASVCWVTIKATVNGASAQLRGNPDCGYTATGPRAIPAGDNTWTMAATSSGGLTFVSETASSCP